MRLLRLKEKYPTARVELWCEDEHRLGLKPVLHKAWSPIGERPVVAVRHRYEWLYLYAFARPNSGETHWLILPKANTEIFSLALESFAKEVGAGSKKRVLLVLDGAGWHTSAKLRVPEGIHLEFLPPTRPSCSPPRGSGRSPMRELPTATSRGWRAWRRPWSSAAWRF